MNTIDIANAITVGMAERMTHGIVLVLCLGLCVALIGLTVSELRSARRIARTDRDLRFGLGDLRSLRRR
jgi:hypothetical protein